MLRLLKLSIISSFAMTLNSCAMLNDLGDAINLVATELQTVDVSGQWITMPGYKIVEIEQEPDLFGGAKIRIIGVDNFAEDGRVGMAGNDKFQVTRKRKTSNGQLLLEQQGKLSPDGNQITWQASVGHRNFSESAWYRAPKDLDGIVANKTLSGIDRNHVFLDVENSSGITACRETCKSNLRCTGFAFNYPTSKSKFSSASCRLSDSKILTDREEIDFRGAFSGIIPERASAFGKGGNFVIRHGLSGRVIDFGQADVFDGSRFDVKGTVFQSYGIGGADQQWEAIYTDLDTYRLKHVETGRFLKTTGDNVNLGGTNVKEAQNFKIFYGHDGAEIRTISAEGKDSGFLFLGSSAPAVEELGGPKNNYQIGRQIRARETKKPAGTEGIWELIPADNFGLFIENDRVIDLINQGAFQATFTLYYDGQERGIFENVANQNISDLILDNIPDELKTAVSKVSGFLVPETRKTVIPETGRISFAVPARATSTGVDVYRIGLDTEGFHEVLIGSVSFSDLSQDGPFCVSAWGVDPSLPGKKAWADDDCTRWGSNTIKVVNQTDEVIYTMWTDEINWSATNLAGGALLGALQSNAQNVNSSIFRVFAISNAWGIELPAEAYDVFKATSICLAQNEAAPVLTWSIFDMGQNAVDVGLTKSGAKKSKSGASTKAKDKRAADYLKSQKAARDTAKTFFTDWLSETAGQSDEYKATYRQYNPAMAAADLAGADTKTILAVNQTLTKLWIIDSSIDDSWIIRGGDVIRATEDDFTVPMSNARKDDGDIATVIKLPSDVHTKNLSSAEMSACYKSPFLEKIAEANSALKD